jgi:predicted transport protein
MALSEKGEQVESVLRRLLPQRGYELLNDPRAEGETGADIIARKGDVQVFIQCIGFQKVAPVRSKQFYEVFFRAISRLKDGATECVLALPKRFGRGLNKRANHYGEAWKRIGDAFPEREIWFVDVKENTYEEHKWNDWPVDPLGNAFSSCLDEETSEAWRYTEEFHLQGCRSSAKDIYDKLKNTFLSIKNTLSFNPTKNYTGIVDKKRIAYIQPKGKKVHLIVLMGEDEVRALLSSCHHDVIRFSESRQRTWGSPNPTCGVNMYDTDRWDEIEKLVMQLVEENQEK